MSQLVQSQRIEKIRKTVKVLPNEHDPFPVILSERFDELSMSKLPSLVCEHGDCLPCQQKNKRMLVAAYEASVVEIEKVHSDLNGLMKGTLAVHVWQHEDEELFRQKAKSLSDKWRLPALRVSDAMHSDLMVLQTPEIREAMTEAIKETLSGVFKDFEALLARMADEQVIGMVNWKSSDVVDYSFFRVSRRYHSLRNGSSSKTEGDWKIDETWKEHDVVDFLEFHEHQLYNATRYQLPADKVRKPKFYEKFIGHVPKWFYPYMFVVEGDMIREDIRISGHHVRTQKFDVVKQETFIGKLYSPCVSLGAYSLMGWSKREF